MKDEFLRQVKEVALEAAREAGDLLMKSLDRIKIVEIKDKQDICTNLDLESEKIIIDRIKSSFPNHNISSEEAGRDDQNSEFTWDIDPIDGTKHYIKGLPIFAVSIALRKGQEIIFGVVFNPATNEMFYATKNQGAFLNDKKIHVSSTEKLADSFISAELPYYKLSEEDFIKQTNNLNKFLKQSYRVRTFGIGSLCLCYVAMGAFEGFIILGSKPPHLYDLAAGIIIAQEAGAKVTDLDNKLFDGGELNIVVSNGKIHNQILSLLK